MSEQAEQITTAEGLDALSRAVSTLYDGEDGSREKDYAFELLEAHIAALARPDAPVAAGGSVTATDLVDVLQKHAPYVRTAGGYGCLACPEVSFRTYDGFAGHQARQQAAALAVVAGIAGVLGEHRSGYWTDPRGWEWAACSGCEWNRDLGADGLLSRSEGAGPHAEHQARAVVEWLAGGGV